MQPIPEELSQLLSARIHKVEILQIHIVQHPQQWHEILHPSPWYLANEWIILKTVSASIFSACRITILS